MKLAIFGSKQYDKRFISTVFASSEFESKKSVELVFHDFPLSPDTVALAQGAEAICVFVNDNLSAPVLESLHDVGVRAILLRCAGFNNLDLEAAERLGFFVANVPAYSPEAVAEFAIALIQTLNRNTHRAYNRVREGNFNLDGLLGKTLRGKTVGIVGVGKIGLALARILQGFGCRLLAFDPFPTDAFKQYGEYLALDDLLPQCDFVSLHCPLIDSTRHIINEHSLLKMKKGAMIVNTSRGGLIHTKSVIAALKNRHLGGLALDVYEAEATLFYQDHSDDIIQDDELMRLLTFPNVLVSGHQAFFTEEALTEISECTLRNLDDFLQKVPCKNSLVNKEKPLAKLASIPVRI
ncbi:hypothetical protein B0T24DRAFT_20897 [Lasiosphaeria ovina]|uniref:D-lactate dehydrogenase n=1 Tax=Lasiosphaeria ovina TaxID=92902 RepID=A0AAE0TX52_9PEZI|nr:hypothetical protein B0T24DRAFT_20897 [Lasiosphaeria ovina]